MPQFVHTTSLPFPREDVFAWHTRPGAFARLQPPGAIVESRGPTNGIELGSRTSFRLRPAVVGAALSLAPGFLSRAGLPWVSEHVALTRGGLFVDEQTTGPFSSWRHEHEFTDGPDGSTVINDRVTWELPAGLGSLAERAITPVLESMFAYRERQLAADLHMATLLPAAPMHVVVTGASGLIGTQLCAFLTANGHRVSRLVRRAPRSSDEVHWNPEVGRLDPAALAGADAVVNLAGRSIGGRLTPRVKNEILGSRLEATGTIVKAIERLGGDAPPVLVNASATGIYGARRPGETLTEDSGRGAGFLADVVEAWEEAAADARVDRLVLMRTGIVLDAGAGALAPQLPLFAAGVGGRLAESDAGFSWITLDDMVYLYAQALSPTGNGAALSGAVNGVAPEPTTSGEFAGTLGGVLHRPSLLPTPAFGPRLVLGREGAGEMVRTDQTIVPAKALAAGVEFRYPELEAALKHVTMKGS